VLQPEHLGEKICLKWSESIGGGRGARGVDVGGVADAAFGVACDILHLKKTQRDKTIGAWCCRI
jgi:hypothetical protein